MRYEAEGRVHRHLLRKQSRTDEANLPSGPSPAASLIIVIALLSALVYFGVARTTAPTFTPATATQAQTSQSHAQD
jgi:hypothetical protein